MLIYFKIRYIENKTYNFVVNKKKRNLKCEVQHDMIIKINSISLFALHCFPLSETEQRKSMHEKYINLSKYK